jgi:phosphatidate cytidylyltransferase
MLKYRLIFGPIMLAFVAAMFYFDNRLDQISIAGTIFEKLFHGRQNLPAGLLMLVVFLAAIPLGAREMVAIFKAKGIEADPALVSLAGVSGCLLMYVVPVTVSSQTAMAIMTTLITTLFLIALVRYSWPTGRTQGAIAVGAVTMLALVYLGLFPGFYVSIRRWHSPWVVAAIIVITKSCDIGAYFTGRSIGKHKLIPWLSPGKTWEGLAGGMIFAGLVAMGLAYLANINGISGHYDNPTAAERAEGIAVRQFIVHEFVLWQAFLGGVVLGGVGQFGDLIASLFKRDAGFKDSGSTIPGFGGVIDVFDSLLVVAPLAYWMLRAAAH